MSSTDPTPRRVVTGVGPDGRSSVVADRPIAAVMTRPGGATISEVWRMDQVPAEMDDRRPLVATTVEAPSATGLAVRVCTFPPTTDVSDDAQRDYTESVASSYGSGPKVNGIDMHRTDTVDVLTVIQGELTLVTESGEAVLRQGDSVVQRGTMHGWVNRSDTTAVVLAVMVSAFAGT